MSTIPINHKEDTQPNVGENMQDNILQSYYYFDPFGTLLDQGHKLVSESELDHTKALVSRWQDHNWGDA